jgi:Domain of unknown function (DUF4203)
VSAVSLVLGLLLIFFGRTLYWAFVAVAGFFVGWELATELLAEQAEWIRILVALAAGVIGAILGMLVQRIAFAIAGLFAGGYLALVLAREAGLPGEPLVWFVIGAILGAIVAAFVMDWAIIVLSSLAGASAVVDPFDWDTTVTAFAFVGLTALGIIVQGNRLRSSATPSGGPVSTG